LSIRNRLGRIVRANRTERAAKRQGPVDPVQAVEAAHAQQVARLDQARRSVADLAANRRRVEILAQQAYAEVGHWDRQAEAAVAMGHEAGAREYLRRSIEAGKRVEGLTAQHRAIDAQVRRLEQDLVRLDHQVHDSFVQFQALRADHGAAQAALQMREATAAAGQQAAGAQAAALEAEREVRRLQARAAAYDEIAGTDPDSARVREAFEQLESDGEVRARLEALERHWGIERPRP
jgi:phage shock protein A